MDQLSAVFQISVFSLCCLGSLMLAVANASLLPNVLTIPLAIVALVVTEFRRTFHLSTAWSNLFGTVALGYAIVRMFPLFVQLLQGNGLPEQGVLHEIVIAGHLLVFLSWIVFFMPKRPREYWAMCTLSVLQVAIGAILTSSGTYGILLVCYVLLGIWTLSIFSIQQTRWQVEENEQTVDWLRLTGADPRAASASKSAGRRAKAGMSLEGYWKRSSQARSTIQIDPHERWISSRFLAGMAATAAVSILISGLFVVFTPRIWAGHGPLFTQGNETDSGALTGFTESVRLGGESRIGESNDLVMRVKLFDHETNGRIEIAEYARRLGLAEPLFRGSVLETYEDSRWTTKLNDARLLSPDPNVRRGVIREVMTIEPTGSGVLFALGPVIAARLDEKDFAAYESEHEGSLLRYRPTVSDLGRIYSMSGMTQEVEGIPWTNAIDVTVYTKLLPSGSPLSQRDLDAYLQFPSSGLDRLRTLAREFAEQARQEGATPGEQVARAMAQYFLNKGEYVYTLELERQDFQIDPLEDFLFNTRAGHCEYYASALAMMLRAAGIPSRLVSGFKGGDVNKISSLFNDEVYDVKQLHAHAWVEAYVNRKWIALDPTPAREIREYSGEAASSLTWQDFETFFEGLWLTYVTNASIDKQRLRIYEPLKAKVIAWWKRMNESGKGWSAMALDLWEIARSPRKWFSWQGALLTAVLLSFVALLRWGMKGSIARLRRLWQFLFHKRSAKASGIAFYERFRKICRARGLERQPSQTQREFLSTVHQSLNDLLASAGLAAFPRYLVDGFYQVRFGGIPLDHETATQIDQNLTRLEQAIQQEKRR